MLEKGAIATINYQTIGSRINDRTSEVPRTSILNLAEPWRNVGSASSGRSLTLSTKKLIGLYEHSLGRWPRLSGGAARCSTVQQHSESNLCSTLLHPQRTEAPPLVHTFV